MSTSTCEAKAYTESTTSKDTQENVHSMSDLLKRLIALSEEQEKISVQHLLETFGTRTFGPLLFIPSAIALFPLTGGIPGMSIFTASIIILVAVQLLLSREHVWLPSSMVSREVPADKLKQGCERMLPYTRKMDSLLSTRWVFLTQKPFSWFAAILSILLALTMYPLALVPFGAAPPSFAILCIATAITMRDGLLMVVGCASTIGSLFFTLWMTGFLG